MTPTRLLSQPLLFQHAGTMEWVEEEQQNNNDYQDNEDNDDLDHSYPSSISSSSSSSSSLSTEEEEEAAPPPPKTRTRAVVESPKDAVVVKRFLFCEDDSSTASSSSFSISYSTSASFSVHLDSFKDCLLPPDYVPRPLYVKEAAAAAAAAVAPCDASHKDVVKVNNNNENNNNKDARYTTNVTAGWITLLGYGSLLSEKSARTTFPHLRNFRLARVQGYRRYFGHPGSFFFTMGIADKNGMEMAACSAEPTNDVDSTAATSGFVVSAFDIPHDASVVPTVAALAAGAPSQALLEREAAYDFVQVPYVPMTMINHDDTATFVQDSALSSSAASTSSNMGYLCVSSTDATFLDRWGRERFEKEYSAYNVDTIWHWKTDSAIRPCPVYLRHCYLASARMGPACHNSFLDESYLVDRTTTIRQYLLDHPNVLMTAPPPALALRYNG